MSRFRNRSGIAAFLALLGLTAAAAANFGFGRGRLGFFLGLGFFLVSALCQLIFRNKALASAGVPEEEEQGGYRLTVLHRTELSLALDLVLFSAVLPLLSLEYDNAALLAGSWLAWGGALAAGTAALCCIVCWLLNGYLRKKPEYGAGEKAELIYWKNHRLKGCLGLALAVLFVFTGLAHYSLTRIWGPGTIMEGIEFEDLNSFAEFMEKEEGVPLDGSGYSAKFYDEQGNEISPQEANRKYLTDGNGKVILEYVQNNRTVCSVQASFRGDELLELRAFTYEELERARATIRQRNGIFAAVYAIELLAVTAVYFKKRAK